MLRKRLSHYWSFVWEITGEPLTKDQLYGALVCSLVSISVLITRWWFQLNALDTAGASAVHLVGGVSGLVATVMLKPRQGRYDGTEEHGSGNMTNALVGMFMLWWVNTISYIIMICVYKSTYILRSLLLTTILLSLQLLPLIWYTNPVRCLVMMKMMMIMMMTTTIAGTQ